VRGHGVHSHKKFGEIAQGVAPKDAKTCFGSFCNQYNADFWLLILH